MKKTIIIGASHSGQMVARELKRFDADHEVILIEKETVTPFIASGINLVLKQAVGKLQEATAPIADLNKIGVKSYFGYEVIKIDWQQKIVFFTDGVKKLAETYENLVLATGSRQYVSKKYAEFSEIYCYKSFFQSQKLMDALETAQTIAISGLGHAGVELAEALLQDGKKVVLFGPNQRLLQAYYDKEISDFLLSQFERKKTAVLCADHLIEVTKKDKGLKLQLIESSIDCDLLVIANNSRPNSELYWDGVTLLPDKSVAVNSYLQTTRPNVYAVGDLIGIPELITNKKVRLSKVTHARQTARTVASNISGKKFPQPKYLNTSSTELFGFYLGSVGLTKEQAQQERKSITTIKVGTLASTEGSQIFLHIDLNEQIVGMQILSKQPVQIFCDLLAIVIRNSWRITDLYYNATSFFPMSVTLTPLLNEAAADYLANFNEVKKNSDQS